MDGGRGRGRGRGGRGGRGDGRGGDFRSTVHQMQNVSLESGSGGRGDYGARGENRGGFRGRGENRGGGRFGGQGGDRGENFTTYPESTECKIIKRGLVEPGTEGRKVELLANFFPIRLTKPIVVYQYDIGFGFKEPKPNATPDEKEKELKFFVANGSLIFNAFLKNNSQLSNIPIIYDGFKNLYTLTIIDTSKLVAQVPCQVKGRNKDFVLQLKLVDQKIDLSHISNYYQNRCSDIPESTIHFLDLMFQNVISQKYTVHMRKFFDTKNHLRALKGPRFVSYAPGFSDHIRPTEIGLALNIHVKTSCIINPQFENLKDLVGAISGRRSVNEICDRDLPRINNIIKGLKCFTDHGGCKRTYSIKSLLSKTPSKQMLEDHKDPSKPPISISEYFRQKYNINVQELPLVKMAGGKDICIPLELCFMCPDQFLHNSKLDGDMQNDMLTHATKKPIIYLNTVTNYAKDVLNINKSLMSSFGVDYTPQPVRFFGRVLDAPRQKNGGRSDPFYQTTGSPDWLIFSFDKQYFGSEDLKRFVEDIKRCARNYRLDLSKCVQQIIGPIQNYREVASFFENITKRFPSCRLIFLILPSGDTQLYSMIKHCGDQKYGLVTQCVLASKAIKRGRGYIDNLLLKVNGKLGGINSIIDESCLKSLPINVSKTMIVGIDVNHPSETEQIESSVAAAVGSFDNFFTLYSASVRVQKKNRDEIISCLEEMIDELLKMYAKKNNYYPDNMIVFRDGVSEGQFQYAETEIKQIRVAFRKVNKNGKFVFIVTQKRHNTRFVLSKPSGPADRPTYNVPSGTVVDHTIVEPSHQIFYINSHFSPLGTSKPLKYIVLENDFGRNLSNDKLQKLCFYCCHNCTRFRGGPIALPTAVRYADLCAYRAKLHIEIQVTKRQRGGPGGEEMERILLEQINQKVKISNMLQNVLYYC